MFPARQGEESRFPAEHSELQALLTAEEYQAARNTVINAHYTSPAIAQAMWDAMGVFGFAGGRVLEAGCGAGTFVGLAPLGTAMVGIELDPVTAAIAAALYPHARIRCENFARTADPEGSYDAAIGNVPFGSIHLRDDRYNPGRQHPIHTHFILKAAALTRPGGLIALITSRYTMDSTGADAVEARRRLAALGELAAAVRLPSAAHRRTAGTTVVTDVLVIRRFGDGEEPPADPPAWVQTVTADVGGQQVDINRHYAANPAMVLGELAAGGARRADDLQVIAAPGFDVAAGLAAALGQAAAARAARPAPVIIPPAPGAAPRPDGYQQARPDGTFTRIVRRERVIDLPDGETSRIVDHPPELFTPPGSPAEHAELRALLAIRDTALDLLDAELATSEDAGLVDDLRARLNARYDSYTATYGPVNRSAPQIRIRQSAQGQALREQLLAGGRARMSGGTVEVTDPAARDQLLAARHAVTGDGGIVRFKQTRAARAARDRLIGSGQARVTGGSLQISDAGKAWILENLDGLDEAVKIIRIRPGQGGFRNDPYAARVLALENYDPETGTAAKRDIMQHRVLLPRPDVERAEDPKDALAICLDRHGQVRLDVIAGLLSAASEDEARARLGTMIFRDPAEDRLVPAAAYLSGDVREKLRQARAAADAEPAYQGNVTALEEVIPADLGPADISARLGAVFITPAEVEQFLREILMDTSVTVRFDGGKWDVDGGSKRSVTATITWGTDDKHALELAENLLNRGAPVEVTRTVKDKTVVDEEATLAAREKQAELSDRFAGWVWEDLDRAREVCRRYNDTFNAIVLRSYDDVQLSLPGVNTGISLFWWQKAAIARMIYEPTALLGHDMGAGKTLEQIIGAMEQKRLGLIRKPCFVVKNHLLEQFAAEFMWAYPQARIMCADSSDLAGDGRRSFIARAAAENPDAIILTQRGFESIPLTAQGHEAYLAYMKEMFAVHAESEKDSVKDQVTLITEFEEQLRAYFDPDYEPKKKKAAADGDPGKKKAKKRVEQDPSLCWEQLGVDYLLVDESQDFNNLWVPSAEPGMAIGFTHRAIDLEAKLHAMRARYGPRVVTFATGTPVTNKIPQYYVLMRYLNPQRLKRAGFVGYAPWAATHTEPEMRLEMKANGEFGLVTRMRLINLQELLLDLHYFGDFKNADDIGLPRPALRGGKPEIRGITGPPELYDWQATLPERYDDARKGGRQKKEGDDTVVAVLGDGFRAAQDLRLVHPRHGAQPDPPSGPQKIDYLADDIIAEWLAQRYNTYDSDVAGCLQAVFCNEGTPKAGWNLYDELRALLVARGMPRQLIRIIHDASDARKKTELFAACNAGHVAVLVTSTEKGGVGTNYQRRCIGVQHVHPHWRPDYGAQEDARCRRPGNLNPVVFSKWWLTEGSFDTTRAQASERKAVFLHVMWRRDPSVRSIDVPGEDQVTWSTMAAIAAGEPRLMQKAQLESKVRQLARAQRRHSNEQNALQYAARQARAAIGDAEQMLRDIDTAEPRVIATAGDAFAMTVGGTRYTSRRDAADRLTALLRDGHARVAAGKRQAVAAGTIGGFDITAVLMAEEWRERDIELKLDGLPGGTLELNHRELPGGTGLVTRLENKLSGLGKLREEQHAVIGRQRQEIERAEAAIGVPFPQQEALDAATKEHDALVAELRTDKKDTDDEKGTSARAAVAGGPRDADPPGAAAAAGGGSGSGHPNAAPVSGRDGARANALAVLGADPAIPDAVQFADWYARTYGHRDPGTWPLAMQAYADTWLPLQGDDHPLRQQGSPPAAGPAADPDAWPPGHPFAADVGALLQAALADPDLAAVARANRPENFMLVFADWPADQIAENVIRDGPGPDPPFARAFFDDASLAAAVTAALARPAYLAHADPARAEDAATTEIFTTRAAGRAVTEWRKDIGAARAARCGCDGGCRKCALPRDPDPALHDAVTADMALARAGIRLSRPDAAGPGPGLPYARTITWDDTAGGYAVEITGDDGSQFQLTVPAPPADWQVQGGTAPPISLPGTGTRPVTRPAAVRYLLGLLTAPAGPAPSAGPVPGAGEAAAPGPGNPGMTPQEVRELAWRHGLTADADHSGVLFIRRETVPGARWALRQEQPGLPLLDRTGRIIPPGSADAYLTAWLADPDGDRDQLYARAIPDTGHPPADEHASARWHSACSDASLRARDTGRDHYLYPDGRATVAAARPPASAAYYAVSPAGQWTRHMNGAAEAIGHRPDHGALSLIAGETAAAPSAPGTAPDRPNWTATHPYAPQITAMRDAALADVKITASARNSDWQNFTITFTAWARQYFAAAVRAAAAAGGTLPDWARAFQDDHSLTADLAATLASQVRQQAAGTADAGGEDLDEDAVTAAARGWQQRAEQARAAAHGCQPGCGQCPLPAGPALRQAAATDMHLARYGIPHTRRAVSWYDDDATWDVAVNGGAAWRRLLAGTADEQPPAGPAETARQARAQLTAATAPAGGEPASPPAAIPATAQALRELAARHGLITERGDTDEETIIRAEVPEARHCLSLYGGLLVNAAGRVIPGDRAEAYAAAYAASPRAHPDLLYAQAVTGTASRDPARGDPAGDRAFPHTLYHHARDDAAARARLAGATWHVYSDGRAYVTTGRPPATAAYLAVTAAGQWTSHLDGAAEPLPGQPGPHDFSALAGALAAAAGPPGPGPGSSGPAAAPDPGDPAEAAAGPDPALPAAPGGQPGGGPEEPDEPAAAQPGDRAAALQDLAARHGLAAQYEDWNDEASIYRRSPYTSRILRQERPGGPLLDEPGRVIPADRADAYLAAWAAAGGQDTDQLYAQAATADPQAAAAERAFALSASGSAARTAADQARATGTSRHVYGDGRALVVTSAPPAGLPCYTVSADGRWTGTAGTFPLEDRAPQSIHLTALAPDPGPDPDRQARDEAAPAPAGDGSAAPVPPGSLIIEHGQGGTVIRGTSRGDTELNDLLLHCGFWFSQRHQFWYLPRTNSFNSRDRKVTRLRGGLGRIGRAAADADNPLPAGDGPAEPLPDAEPYPGLRAVTAGYQRVLQAYSDVTYQRSGTGLFGHEQRDDVTAVRAAAAALRDFDQRGPAGPARGDLNATLAQLADLMEACARTTRVLQANLDSQRRRAPKFRPVLDAFSDTALAEAARMAATAAAGLPGISPLAAPAAEPGPAPGSTAPPAADTPRPAPDAGVPDAPAPPPRTGPGQDDAAATPAGPPGGGTPPGGGQEPDPAAAARPAATTGTVIPRITVLNGHDQEADAYLIEDYPYGRQLRCRKKMWREQAAKGQATGQWRSVYRTTDPRAQTERWNQPKASTYSALVILYLDGVDHDGQGTQHAETRAIGTYGPSPALDALIRADGTYEQLTAEDRARYDKLAGRSRRHREADHSRWDTAVTFMTARHAETGALPSLTEVRQAAGHLEDRAYDVACLIVRHHTATAASVQDSSDPAAAGPAAAGRETASPAPAPDAGSTGLATPETGTAAAPGPGENTAAAQPATGHDDPAPAPGRAPGDGDRTAAPPAAPAPPAGPADPPGPDRGEPPYAGRDDASSDYAQARRTYRLMLDTEPGRALFTAGPDSAADAAALEAAWQGLPDGDQAAGPARDLAAAFAAWAQAAQRLTGGLDAQYERQPRFLALLRAVTRQTRQLAARTAATADAGGFPGEPAPAPAGLAASTGAGRQDTGPASYPDLATAPIWEAALIAGPAAAARGCAFYVYRDPAEDDIQRCVITATRPHTAGFLTVTADGQWTETWRGQERLLDPGPAGRPEPDYPITLTEARTLARACRLQVSITRAAGQAFISLSEPATLLQHRTTGETFPGAPAVSFEAGGRDVFAGGRTTAPAGAATWLAAYRQAAGDRAAAGDIFTASTAPGWACRLAHLVPHIMAGRAFDRDVAEHLEAAVRSARRGDNEEAERQLRRAEAASPALQLAPARAAAITGQIDADAARYAELTGDPARYIAEIMQATPREWAWIQQHIDASPGGAGRDRAPAASATQAGQAAGQAALAAQAKALLASARAAYDQGRLGEAAALVDDAEVLDPIRGANCARARQMITDAAAGTAPAGSTSMTAGDGTAGPDPQPAAREPAAGGQPAPAPDDTGTSAASPRNLPPGSEVRARPARGGGEETITVVNGPHRFAPGGPLTYVGVTSSGQRCTFDLASITAILRRGPAGLPEPEQAADPAPAEEAAAAPSDSPPAGDPGPAAAPAAGPAAAATPADRIVIDATRRNPVISGTGGQDPAGLAQALRDNHFTWRDQAGHWEYDGPAAGRSQAVAAIRQVLARPGAAASSPHAPAATAAGAGQPAGFAAATDGGTTSPAGPSAGFMNDAGIEEAAARWADHPVLGPATRTLAGLQAWADASSDGWAAWPAPAHAARQLIGLILRDGTARYVFDRDRADATPAELRKAYMPLRRFRTRYTADFELVDPVTGAAAPDTSPASGRAPEAAGPGPGDPAPSSPAGTAAGHQGQPAEDPGGPARGTAGQPGPASALPQPAAGTGAEPGEHPEQAAGRQAAAPPAAAAAPAAGSSPSPPGRAPGASAGPGRSPRLAPKDVEEYNRLIRGQRARLATAISSGDPAQVLTACRNAVTAWNLPGNGWPPDSARWQAALDQAAPAGAAEAARILLEDLAAEPVPPDPAEHDDEPPGLFDLDELTGSSVASVGAGAGAAPPDPGVTAGAATGGAERDPQPPASAAGADPAAADSAQGQAAGSPPAGPVPVTNAGLASALQRIAGSSTGAAWSVAEFIVHGTPPGPGAAHSPGTATTWDSDGLRCPASGRPDGGDGTLTWGHAAQWIHAGMTAGDLRVLVNAGQLAAFCDGWLAHLRGAFNPGGTLPDGAGYPEGADQGAVFRETGRAAAAILRDCITRVTDAAAQAHGPGSPVPASPAGTGTYRHEQVAATPGQARALAAISELGDTARQASRTITGFTEAPAKDTGPAGRTGKLTSQDLAIALKHLRSDQILSAITGTPPACYGWHTSRPAGTPDAGAAEEATGTASGLQITLTTAAGTRSGTVPWKQIAAWLAPALTEPRRRLLEQADRARTRYLILRNEYCIGGTSEQRAVAAAEQELSALCSSAVAGVVDTALAVHGPGLLPRLTAARAAARDGGDALFTGTGEPDGQDTGPAMQRIIELASVLPAWPPRWAKPLSQVQPGDILKHSGNLGDPFTVTAQTRPGPDVTAIDGTLQKSPPDTTTTWMYAHKGTPDPQVDFYPPGGPLTGPVPPAVQPSAAISPGPPAAAPPAAGSPGAGTSPASPLAGVLAPAGPDDARDADQPAAAQDAPAEAGPAAGCAVCGDPMDPALAALYATHPCCDPLEGITADATAGQIITLAAQHGLQPRPGDSGPGDPVSIIVGVPGQAGGVIRLSRDTGRILSADLTPPGATEPRRYTRPASIRAVLRALPPGPGSPAPAAPPAAGAPGSTAASQPAGARPGPAGPDRAQQHCQDELHAAVVFLAVLPGYAPTADGPGFTSADTGLGMFLADLPAGQWTGQLAIAAWAMLGGYAIQLGDAGINYDTLPRPPGAEDMTGAELTAARGQAEQDRAATWPGLLRGRHGARFVRCDGHGAPVMLGYDTGPGSDLAREAAQIPGARGHGTAAGVCLYPFASLPDVVALAGRHGIEIPGTVRALAAAAGREPAAGTPGPGRPQDLAAVHPDSGPAASPAGRVTGSDLAIALRRMPAEHFAAMTRDGRDPAWYQFDGHRGDDEPDPGASELLEYGRAGIRIRVGAPDGARDGTVTWPQIRAWIQDGLPPARQLLIAAAATACGRYSALAGGYSLPGTPARQVLQQGARELDGIARQAIGTAISAALSQHGAGPLPRRMPGRRGGPAGTLLSPAPGGGRPDAETAALARVAQLASVLPAWPPRWEKPLSQVQPGDTLRRAWQGSFLFTVTAPPRRAGNVTRLAGAAPDGQLSTWEISHDHHPDPPVEVIPAGGPLTGPVPAPGPGPATAPAEPAALPAGPRALPRGRPPGGLLRDLLEVLVPDRHDGSRPGRLGLDATIAGLLELGARRDRYQIGPASPRADYRPTVALDEQAARTAAGRLSRGGEQIDITYIPAGGEPRIIASYLNGEPVPAISPAAGEPDPARPAAAAGPPTPAPAPAPAAGPAGPRAVPAGITPLAADTASGSWHRPHRLVYADGTPLTCRPAGRHGPSWAGIAAGIVPGRDSGWLQAVRREDGEIVTVHPAAITPEDVNPYAQIRVRDQQRFDGFDRAEAAGRDAALTYALLVEEGDQVRVEVPPRSGNLEIREVTSVRRASSPVWIGTAGLDGGQREDPYASHDRIEVMLPGWHPAEDGPAASRLFAPRPYQIRPAGPAAPGRDRTAGHARPAAPARPSAGPSEADQIAALSHRLAAVERELARLRDAAVTGPGGWQASLSMPEALGRARPRDPGHADLHGWGRAAGDAQDLMRAQEQARQGIAGLDGDPDWQRVGRAAGGAHRLAADAGAGQLRYADPARASRAWQQIWAEVCEITGDMAGALMPMLRRGGRAWRAARRLRHTAAEASAHAHGWLPRGQRLPPGSYPDGMPTARAAAQAAGRARSGEPHGQPEPGSAAAGPAPRPGGGTGGQAAGTPGAGGTLEFPGRHAASRAARRPGRHAAPRVARAPRQAPPSRR